MSTQLLLTFTDADFLDNVVDEIQEVYELSDNRIFVLQHAKNPNELFLTYNVVRRSYHNTPRRTISIHRKKDTNTLYTINAVNQAILKEVGVYDHSFELNWNEYQNSLLLVNNYGLRVIPTELMEVIKI